MHCKNKNRNTVFFFVLVIFCYLYIYFYIFLFLNENRNVFFFSDSSPFLNMKRFLNVLYFYTDFSIILFNPSEKEALNNHNN